MTPQEAQMLQDLVRKVQQTQLTEKDPDAAALLSDGLGRDPDALYKLAQTVLVQNLALDQARAQIDQLRQQPVPQPARATSFLGSLLHREPAAPPPQYPPNAQQYAPAQYPQAQYQAPPQYQPAPPAYQPAPAPSGAGSFLRSAATTAAGVAAGALAFEGIESLMHGGFGSGPGFGGGYGGYGGAGAPVEETVVNNYYGDPNSANSGDQFAQHHEQEAAYDDRAGGPDMQPQGPYNDGPDMQPQGPFANASDRDDTDDGPQLDDASYDPQADDSGFFDDSSDGGDDSLV